MPKIRKVLLITPPETHDKSALVSLVPQLGAVYIASLLAEHCEVKILDALALGYHKPVALSPKKLRYGLTHAEVRSHVE